MRVSVYEWHMRAICPECGWHTYAPFGSLYHVHYECCPKCGNKKGTYRHGNLGGTVSWSIETMRLHVDRSNVVLWNPLTWMKSASNWQKLDEVNE